MKKQPFDVTDHLILYLVRTTTTGSPDLNIPPRGGVLTTMLAKMLFLIDVWSIQASGIPVTGFRYIRYKHGPYPLSQFEDRIAVLEGHEIVVSGHQTMDGRSYKLFKLGPTLRFNPVLDARAQLFADTVLSRFAEGTLEDILAEVYAMPIVRRTEFGSEMQILELAPKKENADEFLSAVAKHYSAALKSGIPQSHRDALIEAEGEPTNENVELTQRMRKRQQKAFGLRGGR